MLPFDARQVGYLMGWKNGFDVFNGRQWDYTKLKQTVVFFS